MAFKRYNKNINNNKKNWDSDADIIKSIKLLIEKMHTVKSFDVECMIHTRRTNETIAVSLSGVADVAIHTHKTTVYKMENSNNNNNKNYCGSKIAADGINVNMCRREYCE